MNCLETLQTILDGITQTLTHGKHLSVVYKVARSGNINYASLSSDQKDQITKAFNSKPPEHDISEPAMLVIAWGAFEQFIRRSFSHPIEELNRVERETITLSDSLYAQHLIYSCKAIDGAFNGTSHYKHLDYRNLSSNLNCAIHDSNFTLNPEAFAIIDFKFKPDKFVEAYNRIGLNLSWQKIGSSKSIQKYFGIRKQTIAGNFAKNLFERVYEIRCNFAHTGAESRTLSPDENIDDLIAFLKSLSEAIFEQVETYTSSLISTSCS